MEDLVIIGTGCAGYTAALYAARANLNPLVLAGDLPGGLLTQTSLVENYPGFQDGVMGFDLMEAMQGQAERFGARLDYARVEDVAFQDGGPHQLSLAGGKQLEAKAVIIATGASHRRLGLEAEDKLETKGVTYCALCDGAFFRDVPHVVVGGGDSAMEEALFLTKYGSKITVVHRRDAFRASEIMAQRVLDHPKIEVAWNSVVVDIKDVEKDEVTGVVLEDTQTGERRDLDCGAVFIAIGHVPSTKPFVGHVDTDENGYILVDGDSSRTNVEGVFAAGDCVDHVYRQAVTAAGMGCRAAIDAERWLASQG